MAKVYFLDLQKKYKDNFLEMFEKLIYAAEGTKIVKKNSLCAVKVHFGEDGNLNFVSPRYVHRLVEIIKRAGGRPFLTDTTTLYSGPRFRADTHIELAKEHGFDFAPVIIADGLYGDEYEELNGAKIARVFKNVNIIFCVSHFKGHLQTGFGATIKNMGMGCAAKGGKLDIHSGSKPAIDNERCTLCLKCLNYCAYQAIKKNNKRLKIEDGLCTGCAGCVAICPERAIRFSWDRASSDIQEGIARYTANLIETKNVFYLNFLTNISPNCDCFHTNEPMISPDIGILVSFDPVALDQAAFDLVKGPIEHLYPEIDPQKQLFYGEKFNVGERKYEIKTI